MNKIPQNLHVEKYLRLGEYTSNCPISFLAAMPSKPREEVDRVFIRKVLRAIRKEFFRAGMNVSRADSFEHSRFIRVAEIVRRRQASCGSLATLVASVLRSLGIPTKLVDGRYRKSKRGEHHAWNEVYISSDKRFVPFDITNRFFGINRNYIRSGEWVDWADLEKKIRVKG